MESDENGRASIILTYGGAGATRRAAGGEGPLDRFGPLRGSLLQRLSGDPHRLEAYFGAVLGVAAEGLFGIDARGRCTFINPAAASTLGYRPEELIGRDMHRTVHHSRDDGSELPSEACPILRTLAVGKPVRVEEDLLWRKDGSSFPALYAAYPVVEQQKVSGAVVLFSDLSERRAAEAEQERYSAQLRGLAEAALEINSAVDLREKLQLVTDRARLIIGAHQCISSLTVDGRWSQAVDAVSLSDRYAGYRGYARPPGGSGIYRLVCQRNAPMRLTQRDLEEHPAWRGPSGGTSGQPPLRGWLAAPLTARDGSNIGLIQLANKEEGEFTDNDEAILVQLAQMASVAIENSRLLEQVRSHAQELERRVEERTAALRSVNDELESFNYSVSHDLRAPLRSIRGFGRLLEEEFGAALPERGRHYLSRMLAGSQRMAELIDDLLGLSSLTGKELRRECVDLSALVREISAELRQRDPERQVHFDIVDGIAAEGDGRLLRVALENLLSNAWKFTARKAEAVISFGCRRDGPSHIYFVQDNGAGFDMRLSQRLFVAFHRLHSESDFAGTGIGLATVQRVVHRHGGRIWAQGKPQQGATFFFTLG